MIPAGRGTATPHAAPRGSYARRCAALFAATALWACGRLVPEHETVIVPVPTEDAGTAWDAGCSANLQEDVYNCGACGFVCPAGDSCQSATCLAPPTSTYACSTREVGCGPLEACCDDRCVNPATDPANCGSCDNVCPTNQACIDSKCGGCYFGQTCTAAQSCCPTTGCSDVTTDALNCGSCGWQCPAGDVCVASTCVLPCNGGAACGATQTCCGNGCVDERTDPANCGTCGVQCGSTATCLDGQCVANEGAFHPTVSPTYLSPGAHSFTTITVPAGVTVYVAGTGTQSGTLDLHATGAIEIDGTIDLSGGPGTPSALVALNPTTGRAGGGGFTGEPYMTAAASVACSLIAGNSGALGMSVAATPGTCPLGPTTCVAAKPNAKGRRSPSLDLPDADVALGQPTYGVFAAPPAAYGGGAGVLTGYRAYGSGGGGPAGGAPGWPGAAFAYEPDCAAVAGGGGAVQGHGGVGGGAPYDGADGVLGETQCGDATLSGAHVGGGAGGSIGKGAADDLAVSTTFQTGSGGGGGSADYADRPYSGGTSGGGGGGGALKLETTATITIQGSLLANGGAGADAYVGTPASADGGCDPQPGAAGGGGSGGVIYLSAPSISVAASASISAVGGVGGAQSQLATGGSGGAGGMGRIRLSVGASTCALAGTFQPPLASGCQPSASGGTPGTAYVGLFPN